MSVERNGKFITLSAGSDSIQLPFAAYESGKQTIATVVDQARTADGIVRGSVVAKASKIEPDKACIKLALANGIEIPGAELVTKNNMQIK